MLRGLMPRLLLCFVALSVGTMQTTFSSPMYSAYTSSSDLGGTGTTGKYSNRVVVAEVDKSIDSVLEAVLELGGNVLLLVPRTAADFEKRDPPDLGTGRSYSGQRTAKVMWGQLASNSPSGPGKKKRSIFDKNTMTESTGPVSFLSPEEV